MGYKIMGLFGFLKKKDDTGNVTPQPPAQSSAPGSADVGGPMPPTETAPTPGSTPPNPPADTTNPVPPAQ